MLTTSLVDYFAEPDLFTHRDESTNIAQPHAPGGKSLCGEHALICHRGSQPVSEVGPHETDVIVVTSRIERIALLFDNDSISILVSLSRRVLIVNGHEGGGIGEVAEVTDGTDGGGLGIIRPRETDLGEKEWYTGGAQ